VIALEVLAAASPLPSSLPNVRYNAELTAGGLSELGLSHIPPQPVEAIDSVEHVADLEEIGKAVADKSVRESHFERF
jgi:hypothetical protein